MWNIIHISGVIYVEFLGWPTNGNVPPPPKLKTCCRKMRLFPKALFLASTFPKVSKNSIFLLNFYQKFSKFSQNFQTICVVCANAPNGNMDCLILLKRFENNGSFAIFLWNFLKIFSKFPNNLFFRPNARKINKGILNFCSK